MNLELYSDYLTDQQKELLDKTTVIQQSWYTPGTDFKEFPLVKVHPVTGKKSLRLNYYNDHGKDKTDAWITGVKIDGVLQPDCTVIADLLKHLEKVPEQESFILEILSKLALLMQENDTFSKVLWKHFQTNRVSPLRDSFLMFADIWRIKMADLTNKYPKK
jgi:hypothetical protein